MTTTMQKTPSYIARLAEDWGEEKLRLLKDTIARDLDLSELGLFVEVARAKGLDPFARQIYAVKRYDKKAGREVMTIQTGIDGFRSIAERTGKYEGQGGPWWCGKDGVWREVWVSTEAPVAAKVEVYKSGFRAPLVGIAHFAEYAQTFRDGNPMGLWGTHPRTMIAKCAESVALRRAFPQQLSGIYTADEISVIDVSEVSTEANAAHMEALSQGLPRHPEVVEPEVIEAEVEESEPKPKAKPKSKPKPSRKEPAAPSGGFESATSALLEFCGIIDDADTVELVDTHVELWSDELKKLKRGAAYARAWALQKKAELRGDSDELLGLKDDDEHRRMLDAIELMRSNRADAQGENR